MAIQEGIKGLGQILSVLKDAAGFFLKTGT